MSDNAALERQDLKREPLPKGKEDEHIPTDINSIDNRIQIKLKHLDSIEQEISQLRLERDAKIKRAKELGITSDTMFKIVEDPVYENRRVDVPVLQMVAPEHYAKIVANVETRLADKYNTEKLKVTSFISQADVKAVVSDKVLLAKVIPESTVIKSINVVVVPR